MSAGPDVTALLQDWHSGNRQALDAMMPIVMNELRRIASGYLGRENADVMLQTTVLVNEAYLRLVGVKADRWESRVQFFALSAQIMRRILVDHARTRLSAKRGAGALHISLDSNAGTLSQAPQLMALHEALLDLGKLDRRKSEVAEMRVFGGLNNDETAHALGISPRTVIREWRFAKAWLARELKLEPR